MQTSAFSLQNKSKSSDKTEIIDNIQQDPNYIQAFNSNNNSNQSTSRQSLKMQIGSKLDKISALSNKKFINGSKNSNKINLDPLQLGKNQESIKKAINQIKNMPNNVPPSATTTAKPHRTTHGRSKNLSIQIQNPAQNQLATNTSTNINPSTQPSNPSALQRNNSNNSIISELELDQIQAYEIQDPHKAEEKLIIKICDGVYIGGQDSIWDVDTLALNYISHLVRVNQVQHIGQNKSINLGDHKHKQQYVPELITYIHSISYEYNPQNSNQNNHLLDLFKKITQFIQHSHQQGQSCLIICRNINKGNQNRYKSKTKRKNSKYNTMNTQENQMDKQKERQCQRQDKERCFYQCLYKPAVIVAGFLMNKYSWSMLKALQFVLARLTAGQKTAQMLSKISSKQSNKHSKNASSQTSNHNTSLSNMYSQLLTHMLPQLPHTQTAEKMPTIHNLPIKSLQNLQIGMISNNRSLTYGWNKNKQKIGSYIIYDEQYLLQAGQIQWSSIKQEQLVLTNTYINCMMGSDSNSSYKGILQEDLNSKSITNLRSYSNNNSVTNLSTNLNNRSMQIKSNKNISRSQKFITNTNQIPPINTQNNNNNKSTNSSKQKQTRHSLDIILKKPLLKATKSNSNTNSSIIINRNNCIQVDKKIDQLQKNPSQTLLYGNSGNNIVNSDSTMSLNFKNVNRNHSLSSFKNKNNVTKKKHVTWSPNLITIKQSPLQNTLQNKQQQKMCDYIEQYAKNLKSTYKITTDLKTHSITTKSKNSTKIIQSENNINNSNIIPNANKAKPTTNTHQSQQQNLNDKKIQNLNSQNKTKIVINVMGMIGNKNNRGSENNTQRQQTKLSQLNRKSKLYESKARLPTLYDVLNINTINNNQNNTNTNTYNNTKTNTTNNSLLNSYKAKKQIQYPTQLQNQISLDTKHIHRQKNDQKDQKRKIRLSVDDGYIIGSEQQQKNHRKQIHTQQPCQQQKQHYLYLQEGQQQQIQISNNKIQIEKNKKTQKNKVITETINKLKQIKNNKNDLELNNKKTRNKIQSLTGNVTNNNTNNNINSIIHDGLQNYINSIPNNN